MSAPPRDTDIGIVGLAARLPGCADLDEIWEHLSTGTPLPDGQVWTETPAPAHLDAQQQVLIEVCTEAIRHAGLVDDLADLLTGVAVTCGPDNHLLEGLRDGRLSWNDLDDDLVREGADRDYAALRVAHALDLRGPALTVLAGCAGGIAALHTATRMLLSGDCDVCVVGGAFLPLAGPVATSRTVGRPFDQDAAGIAPGRGAVAFVVRPLDDAEAAGNTIRAVIRSAALRSDGRASAGFGVPSPIGQSSVLATALRMAEVEPVDVGLVQCHGSATVLGDAVELAAVVEVLGTAERGDPAAVAAASSVFGDLDAVSGLASTLSATLALKHARRPPLAGFRRPSEHLPDHAGHLRMLRHADAWPAGAHVAAVLSQGRGGSNGALILAPAGDLPVPDRGAAASVEP